MTSLGNPSTPNISSIPLLNSTGGLLGGILLIAGSCIGAGILALPIFTGFAGFFPSLAVFLVCWLFMTTSALLLIEINSWFPKEIHILSFTNNLLGRKYKSLVWLVFLFLFYLLLVAYIAKGGDLVHKSLERLTGILMPDYCGPMILTAFSAVVTFWGTTRIDQVNRIGMIGLFIVFFFLLGYGIDHTQVSYITRADWRLCLFVLPFIVTSFGFHNMIPSINRYLGCNFKKTSKAVIIGSMTPLVIYVLWLLKTLSLLPLEGPISITNSYVNCEISTEPLAALFDSSLITVCAQYFAFFAIITSILGQAMSVKDFFADGFNMHRSTIKERLALTLMTFLPPFTLSLTSPHIFGLALELTGGVACMILFGILPGCMVWRGRYHLKLTSSYRVPGGKLTLAIIVGFASLILILEIAKKFGLYELSPIG